MVVSNPELKDETRKMTMTIGAFKVEMRRMYTKGAFDKARSGGIDDLFGGIFGGKR